MSARLVRRIGLVLPLLVLVWMTGCGELSSGKKGSPEAGAPAESKIYRDRDASSEGAPPMPAQDGAPAAQAPPAPQPGGNAGGDAASKAVPAERKIIYKGTLEVVVKDLDTAIPEVRKALAAQKGRVIRSEVRSDAGARRVGTFSLEVPVDNFSALVDVLVGLGHPERNSTDSQDVTEEYMDVQIRLKNLKAEHESLIKLRNEKAGSLDEVLKLRPHISAVENEIDRTEGRLKYLETRSAFSTVTLTLKEIKDYVPPSAPTFGNRVGRTFGDSWEALVRFAEGIALFAVALAPWLPILIPLGVAGYFLIRKLRRDAAARRAADVELVESEPEPPAPDPGLPPPEPAT
jgi:hypothetical protein